MAYDYFYMKYLGARIDLFVRFFAFSRNSLSYLVCMLGTLGCQRRQYALTLRRKKNAWRHMWLFPFWRLDVPVWMGERIFAVHALFIRNWPTVFRHRAMVSTCRILGPIIGHWHSLNLCVFSQWKPRFPHGKTDPVSMLVTWPSFNNQGPDSI